MTIAHDILAKAVEMDASDVHLKAEEPPFFRVNGALVESGLSRLSADDLKCIVLDILPEHLKKKPEPELEMDFSHYEEEVGRFRVNVFMSRHVPTIACRYVKTSIRTIAELHLPDILENLAMLNSGMIVLCGPTNCGKSTTLAALLDHINRHQRCRVITVEDPVEYVFTDQQSVITQREVGLDTPSFHSALKHVLRQDPDVIMIGEMRDSLSLSVAVSAAETGHLVLTTLHVNTAAQSVHRILDFFPHNERDQVRMSVAVNLAAALCQRLVPARQGGVRAAVEIMISTPTVRKLIAENKLEVLPAAIETGTEDGMQSFNQALLKLIKNGAITEKDGLAHSPNPEQLKMNLQGIFLDESRRILGE
ncbi:MAG: PilT/PilU family type 4a pilus ATPase [Lentisphaerae bacterium]|nr:PilT/PilU family type 4a pilus ATPase [Lentisphaerota bacterium]